MLTCFTKLLKDEQQLTILINVNEFQSYRFSLTFLKICIQLYHYNHNQDTKEFHHTHTHTHTHIALCYLFSFFLYVWLRWVFVSARVFSLVAVSRGYSSLRCAGFSLRWLLLLWSTGCRWAGFSSCGTRPQQLQFTGSVVVARRLQSTGSVVVTHGLSCSVACGILLAQGSNLCPLHWQADS